MARAYRKKPVTVEAIQWTGENHAEMCEFIDPEMFEIIPRVGLVIHTLEGNHHASPGDYIIKGVNGEFYPCKPDIFAKTYETPTLTPPNEWVSVEERLPEEKQRVIVRCERVGTSVGWILWGNWMTDIGPGAGKVTHWMPLPASPDRRPPEGEEDNND